MIKNKNYTGIDYFRFIAALLIVAIHTSPLASFSETGDFILTRIVARIAVPFFLMTSGFFLVSRYSYSAEKLRAFVKKTAVIYGIAMLIYVPINIYNGYFGIDNLLPNIIKDIVFDGTLYHLWYLPASIMGAVIAWCSVRKLGYSKALMLTSALYIIGLFGDSYYGLAEANSFIKDFYDLIFQVSDYTRNGIFLAPVFLVLGGAIADRRQILSLKKSICGCCVSFVLMFAEAMSLHHFDLQRHDSMYLMLLPCMYFLFNAILHFKGKRLEILRNASLIIYIIHPMMIVVIRLFSKLFGLQSVLVENSIVHYFTVSTVSVLFAIIGITVWNKYKPKKEKQPCGTDRAYLEISLNNLEHNVRTLIKAMPPKCELMAVVKAEAYGHGIVEVATHINKIGVNAFAVATIDEGVMLRRCGVLGEILILGHTAPARAKELHKYDLTQTLIDYEYSLALSNQGYDIKAHIKIDTGMHRLGFDKSDIHNISAAFSMEHIKVVGVYTHLCAADSLDEKDIHFTNMQIENFYTLIKLLTEKGISVPKIHIQSSYGLLNYPELNCDYVRAGVSLYGVLSSPEDKTRLQLDLKPVLSLKSSVISLRKVEKGDSVGYSRSFVAERDSQIAILPIGYADGYPRSLSCGKCYVLINGHKAPIIGKICMDQFAVDVTDVANVKVGAEVTLIGIDGNEEISAPMVAEMSGSITNELLSRIGQRVKVICKW